MRSYRYLRFFCLARNDRPVILWNGSVHPYGYSHNILLFCSKLVSLSRPYDGLILRPCGTLEVGEIRKVFEELYLGFDRVRERLASPGGYR